MGNITVKQRHPSSPMASPPIFDDQSGHPQIKSRTSPYFPNQFYPFQPGFSGHKMASDPLSSQQSFYRGGGAACPPNDFQQQHNFEERTRGFEG